MEQYMLNQDRVLEFKSRIKQENIDNWSDSVKKEGIRTSVFHEQKNTADWFQYDVELPRYGISHQGSTGRCWIFAALNMIRPSIIKEHQLKNILLSHNFIAFYDLLEKANYFLEIISETLDEETHSRFLSLKLLHPVQDAGQWFFFQNVVEKYGFVTQDAMPDTAHSQNTSELIGVLSDLLREAACMIRIKHKQSAGMKEIEELKEKTLYKVYRILFLSLGEPPERFTASLELKDGSIRKEIDVTPREFYQKYVHENYNTDYCMLVNIPAESKPYYGNYKVFCLGNVWGKETGSFLNLPMAYLKELAKKQIEAGIPVWFGCDSRVCADRKNGIYALENFDLQKLGFQYGMLNKQENLQYGLSNLTHAMVIKGISCNKEGKTEKWLIENSYGKETGHQGYFSVSDQWFDLFVYEVVIHKEFLNQTLMDCYKKESIILPPWDILGNLAKTDV